MTVTHFALLSAIYHSDLRPGGDPAGSAMTKTVLIIESADTCASAKLIRGPLAARRTDPFGGGHNSLGVASNPEGPSFWHGICGNPGFFVLG